MTVGGDGLKPFGVDSPAAAAEWMNEQRRYRAKWEIGGVEIGAFSLHRHFTFGLVIGSLREGDAALAFDADGLDYSHQAVGRWPIDLRQVPPAKLLVRFGGDAAWISLGEMLGPAQ